MRGRWALSAFAYDRRRLHGSTRSPESVACRRDPLGPGPVDARGVARAPTPTGLGWLQAVGPGVIVLGVSIGGGEFLLGPGGLRAARPVAALGGRHRRVPPDRVQHRADALHAGHRRAGVHRLHAHAPVVQAWAWVYAILYFLQVGWPASAGDRGWRHLLPRRCGDCRAGGCRRRSTASASAHFCRAWPILIRRPAHRADARDPELDPHRARSLAASSCWRCGSSRRRRGRAALVGFAGYDCAAARSTSSRRDGLVPAGRARRVFRCRRRQQHRAVQLGARQRLRHGRPGRLHPRRGRRHQSGAGAHRVHVRADATTRAGGGAAGGASSAPTSGAYSGWAPSSGCCCRRCST